MIYLMWCTRKDPKIFKGPARLDPEILVTDYEGPDWNNFHNPNWKNYFFKEKKVLIDEKEILRFPAVSMYTIRKKFECKKLLSDPWIDMGLEVKRNLFKTPMFSQLSEATRFAYSYGNQILVYDRLYSFIIHCACSFGFIFFISYPFSLLLVIFFFWYYHAIAITIIGILALTLRELH